MPRVDGSGTGAPIGPLGLRVGERARRTQTVTTREVELYAEITGDRNPLHFDEKFPLLKAMGLNDKLPAVNVTCCRVHDGSGLYELAALLSAADAQDVPLVVLLGSPQYYGRFGFRPAVELGVMPPEPRWGSAFQARPLRAYTPSVAGQFEYAPAVSS